MKRLSILLFLFLSFPLISEESPIPGLNFSCPLDGARVSSPFGERDHIVLNSGGVLINDFHKGVDLVSNDKNAIIHASETGVVSECYPAPSKYWKGHAVYGGMVILDHGKGIYTLYGHMRVVFVKAGWLVKKGDPLGIIGTTGQSTGIHLHFEIIVDPEKMLLFNPNIPWQETPDRPIPGIPPYVDPSEFCLGQQRKEFGTYLIEKPDNFKPT